MSVKNLELINQIKKIISDQIRIDKNSLDLNSSPNDFVQWDSLANIQIYINLQSKISQTLKIEDYLKCKNLEDLYNLLKKC